MYKIKRAPKIITHSEGININLVTVAITYSQFPRFLRFLFDYLTTITI